MKRIINKEKRTKGEEKKWKIKEGKGEGRKKRRKRKWEKVIKR